MITEKEYKYIPDYSNKFEKDMERLKKRWYNIPKLLELLELLLIWNTLSSHYKDHALKWKRKTFRDIHISPNWILIYKYYEFEGKKYIRFERVEHILTYLNRLLIYLSKIKKHQIIFLKVNF
jgi:mRNA interferase YafQ